MNTFIRAIASGYCFYDHGPSGGKGIGSVLCGSLIDVLISVQKSTNDVKESTNTHCHQII